MIFLVRNNHESFSEARKNTYKSKETANPHNVAEIMKKQDFWQVSSLVALKACVFLVSYNLNEGCLIEKKYDFYKSTKISYEYDTAFRNVLVTWFIETFFLINLCSVKK